MESVGERGEPQQLRPSRSEPGGSKYLWSFWGLPPEVHKRSKQPRCPSGLFLSAAVLVAGVTDCGVAKCDLNEFQRKIRLLRSGVDQREIAPENANLGVTANPEVAGISANPEVLVAIADGELRDEICASHHGHSSSQDRLLFFFLLKPSLLRRPGQQPETTRDHFGEGKKKGKSGKQPGPRSDRTV